MKNIILLITGLLCTVLQAQVNVETITNQFKGSGGLSLDDIGNLYIGDFGDFLDTGDGDGLPNQVWKMDINLNLTEYSTNFVGASGNDFDSNGVLYQSDIGNSSIYKIVGGLRTFVTSTGINQPVGIVFDSNDNFFVCNCGNNTIRKVTPGGVSTEFFSGSPLFCPNGITIDEDDNLYISNFSNGKIIKITPTGIASTLNITDGGTTSSASNGHLDYHQPSRRLYIASHGANKIYWLSIDNPSNLQVLAGSGIRGNTDGSALAATFSRPNGVAVSQTGDSIYINSAVPVTNVPNRPLNPQLIRLITGVNSTLAINDVTLKELDVKIYPNPASNFIIIEVKLVSQYNNLQIKIFDMQGKLVNEIKNISGEEQSINTRIDISKLRSGIYFYALYDSDRQLFNEKFIKQ